MPCSFEFIRVFEKDVPGYLLQGWEFSHAFPGRPSEAAFGRGYRDVILVRRKGA